MKVFRSFIFAILVLSEHDTAHAQMVASISRMVTFKESGSVTKADAIDSPALPSSVPQTGIKPVPPTQKISTGANGATSLILDGAGVARMGSDTEVQVPQSGASGHSLELLKGRLFMNIDATDLKKRGNAEFRLKTPTALLAVKGTKFFAISEDAKEIIGVLAGGVAVLGSASRNVVNLPAGHAVTVSEGFISAPRPLTEQEREHIKEFAATQLSQTPLVAMQFLSSSSLTYNPSAQRSDPSIDWVIFFYQGKLFKGPLIGSSPIGLFEPFRTGGDLKIGTKQVTGHFLDLTKSEDEMPNFDDSANKDVPVPRPATILGEKGLKLEDDGSVGYTWNWGRNAADRKIATETPSILNFFYQDRGNPTAIEMTKLVGVSFRIRAQNVYAIKATLSHGGATVFKPTKTVFGNSWIDCVMPISHQKRSKGGILKTITEAAMLEINAPSVAVPFLSLAIYPDVAAVKAKPSRKDITSVSISGIVLLSEP